MKKKRRRKSYNRKKKTSTTIPNFLKLILLLGACAFIIYYFIFRSSSEEPTNISKTEEKIDVSAFTKPEAVDHTLREIFNEFNLLESWISEKDNTFHVRLSQEVPAIVLTHEIMNRMEELDCKILNSSEDLTPHRSTLEIGFEEKLVRKLIFTHESDLKRFQGKIAIIIDDFGYSESEQINELLQFPYQITFSIIPGLSKSMTLYQQAQKNKKETIIHLPMEAIEEKVEYTDYTLYTNMSNEEIRRRVRKALEDFPDSKGINNHMGSKITREKQIMEFVLEELKKSNKYFIDSKTTNQSVAYQTAKELKVPSLENNMFLERERNDSEDYLHKKLIALTKIATKKGIAVAIGHPYENTVKVLMEEIPKLEKQGFVFVSASEIVK